MSCMRPDHDVPGIICGYSLPCPWHTVTIDTTSNPPTVTIPATAAPQVASPETLNLLKEIARSIKPESVKQKRGKP